VLYNIHRLVLGELNQIGSGSYHYSDGPAVSVIMMLLNGSPREKMIKVADLSKSAIKKIIRAINSYGADGLVARRLPGNGYLIGWNGIPP
jgi:hypothetical protein